MPYREQPDAETMPVWTLESAEVRIAELERQLVERQAFKDWVHTYLDVHGVPHHPPGTHGAAGCRIGDRMDWLMQQLDAVRAEREWQPISTAPKDGSLFVGLKAGRIPVVGKMGQVTYNKGFPSEEVRWEFLIHPQGMTWNPSLWCPLPPFPAPPAIRNSEGT